MTLTQVRTVAPSASPESVAARWRVVWWFVSLVSCLSLAVAGVADVLSSGGDEQGIRAAVWGTVFTGATLVTAFPSPPHGALATLWRWLCWLVRRLLEAIRQVIRWCRGEVDPPPTFPTPLPPSRRAVLAGVSGATVAGLAWLQLPPVRVLRGAGWRDLFLTGTDAAQPWWSGMPLDGENFEEVSGMELLRQTTDQDLARLDFVTCPSDYVTDQLTKKINAQSGLKVRRDYTVCTESMVVLGERRLLAALIQAKIVVRTNSGPLRFDLARYINRCTWTWNSVDPALRTDNRITLFGADPLYASGGQHFLLALYDAWKNDPSMRNSYPTAQSLWHGRGPLTYQMPRHSPDLWTKLENGYMNLIFTYQHLALTTMAHRPEDYFVIRTRPEVTVNQHLLALTPQALAAFDTRLADATVTSQLRQSLHIPDRTQPDTLEETTAFGILPVQAMPGLQTVQWDPRTVFVQEADIDEIYPLYRQG